jgi:ABC-type histidine transport system ATPase subunit
MENPEVYNQQNIGFGAILGAAQLDALPPPHANHVHNDAVDPRDLPKIQAWVDQCCQKHVVVTGQCGLIRQMSGGGVAFQRTNGTIGYDSNDYGAYITNAQKRCHVVFESFKQSFMQLDRVTLVADSTKQLITLLQSIDSHFAQSAVAYCTRGEFCEVWKHLDIQMSGTMRVRDAVTRAKTLTASLILSQEHTDYVIKQLSKELVRLEEYVAQYLRNQPMFHVRAWNLMKNWTEKINELAVLESKQVESTGLWQTLFEKIPRSRPTKAACR